MGVMYLFDSLQTVRAAIVDGVTQCVHHESARTLDAAIPSKYQAEPGEYLGFLCVDGLWRLFCITEAEDDDAEGVCYIKATDAAVDDLEHKVVQDKYQEGVTAQAAAAALLEGTGWQLATVTTDDTTNTTDAKWVSLWQALLTLAEVYGAQVEPYYIIQDGEITGKRIDLLKDEPVFRGRLYESRINADDVRQIKRKRPVTVLYGLGKAQGTGDEAENLTFVDVAWSKANGDPADKPAGQTWVEDVEASARYGRRELTFTAGEIEDQGELLKATWEELQKQKKSEITVELTIHDAEQLHGGEWKTVRRGDLVIVRTRAGRDTETRVIDIERDYVRPELTKFTSGKELPKATNQTAGLIRASIKTQETLTLYRNRFEHDEALIQLYANTILVHADELLSLRAGINDNLAQITLQDGKITQTAGDVEDLHTTVTVEADGIREIIQKNDKTVSELKATIDGLEHWVTDADGNVAELTNTVRGLESTVTAADGRVSQLTNTADGLTNTITGQGNELAMLYIRVDEIKSAVMDTQGSMGYLSVKADSVTAKVSNIDGRVTTLAVTADGLTNTITGQGNELSEFKARIDEISSTVKDANGNMGTLITKADSVTARVANVDGRVSQLAVTADGLDYTLTKQGQELSSIKAMIDEISLTVHDTNGAMGQFVVNSDRIAGKLEDANGKLTALQELTDDRFRVVLGDIEVMEGEISTITGSTLWQTRDSITGVVGKMSVDKNGNVYIKEGSGLRVYENGTAYGVFNENNLTAGVIVNKVNGGTAILQGNMVDIEANDKFKAQAEAIALQAENVLTLEAGVNDNKSAIALANGDIAALADDISLNAKNIKANADAISLVSGDITTLEGNISTITGSTLWQNKDSITGVVGKMSVDKDGNVCIEEGSGLRIYKSGVAYGVYDENNLTAGLLVQKLNGSTTAKIKADRINLEGYVTADSLAAESARINNFFSGNSTAAKMIVTNLSAISFAFGGNQCTWTSTEVVTNVRVNATGEIVVRDADGNIAGTAVTGVRCTQDKETIYYITWGTGGE